MWTIIISSIFWTSLGSCLQRLNCLPPSFAKKLGKCLYWVGVPSQIFGMALVANFNEAVWLPPAVTIAVLLLGLVIAVICSHRQGLQGKAERGSFVLASILGNTGFVGMAIAPVFVDKSHLSSILLYGVAHNLVGSYGIGVILASYFGRDRENNGYWGYFRTILSVPALWAFAGGCLLRHVAVLEAIVPTVKMLAFWVIPAVFVLLGIQLAQCRVRYLESAFLSSAIKTIVLPALTGIGLTYLGMRGEARLGLVLMSGMPTAFANAVLAEEYDLDRQLATSSILYSTLFLPLAIPLWLFLFGGN